MFDIKFVERVANEFELDDVQLNNLVDRFLAEMGNSLIS